MCWKGTKSYESVFCSKISLPSRTCRRYPTELWSAHPLCPGLRAPVVSVSWAVGYEMQNVLVGVGYVLTCHEVTHWFHQNVYGGTSGSSPISQVWSEPIAGSWNVLEREGHFGTQSCCTRKQEDLLVVKWCYLFGYEISIICHMVSFHPFIIGCNYEILSFWIIYKIHLVHIVSTSLGLSVNFIIIHSFLLR